ncbi:hypothetical protein GGS26DRAFT_561141 [Hypomontagnella submonticulosa]|nr:hypothetical protein GGS26DRAFT_561141 [Hypomontagnella submonticulosa]
MEPPAKRLRLGQAPYDDDDEDDEALDELSMTPTQFDAKQDPLYQLDKGRAKAANRLKSAFEHIFEKYERDFTGIGDEIDLATGEVIVNNGHLQSLDDEKVRAREGSVSSNEEERIMRGKDAGPARDSHSKSLVRTNVSSKSRFTGSQTRPDQVLMTNSTHSQPPPIGIYPDLFNSANPFIFSHGPIDPLWQTPEISVPLYRDRFGFIGQAMGHSHHPGYGHGPMLLTGRGHDSPSGIIPRQVPRKLPCREATGREDAASNVDDSEDDDILLGGCTQALIKRPTTTPKKSSPLHTLIRKADQVRQLDTNHDVTISAEQPSQKPRRRPSRPKKTVPANRPESSGEVNREPDGNSETGLSIHILESTSTAISKDTPTPSLLPSPTRKESTMAKESAQTEVPTSTDTKPVDSQQRRSSRSRKQTQFYGKVSWMKGRRSGTETSETPNSKENVANLVSASSTPERDEPSIHTKSSRSSDEDRIQSRSAGEFNAVGIEEPPSSVSIAALDHEHHSDISMDQEVISESEQVRSDRADSFPIEGLGEPGTSCMNTVVGVKQVESPSADTEAPSHDTPILPGNPSNNEESCLSLEDSAQGSIKSGELRASSPNNVVVDTSIEAGGQTTSPTLTGNEMAGDSNEIRGSDIVGYVANEETQTRAVQTPSGEPTNELSAPVQGRERSLETDTIEPVLLFKDAAARSKPLEQATHPIDSMEELTPALAQTPTMPLQSKKHSFSNTSNLALRPSLARDGVSSTSEQTDDPNITNTPNSLKSRPPPPPPMRPAEPSAPSTPKKRGKAPEAPKSRSSSRRTTSTKKKFALASLVPDDPADDDDDELSVLSSSAAPSPFLSVLGRSNTNAHRSPIPSSASATPRKTSRRHGFLMGPSATPHRITKRGAPPATDSRASRAPGRHFVGSGVQSSPLARIVMNVDNSDDVLVSTPSRRAKNQNGGGNGRTRDVLGSSPVRTPGGSVRRCGEGGFVCDRDFCFTCCR